jgi:hypothetical protein
MRMKPACVTLFGGALWLLYYVSAMLLLVPGDPGESYLSSVFWLGLMFIGGILQG